MNGAYADPTERRDAAIRETAGLPWPPPEIAALVHGTIMLFTEWRDLMGVPPPFDTSYIAPSPGVVILPCVGGRGDQPAVALQALAAGEARRTRMSFRAFEWALGRKYRDPLARLLMITLAMDTGSEPQECYSLERLALQTEIDAFPSCASPLVAACCRPPRSPASSPPRRYCPHQKFRIAEEGCRCVFRVPSC